MEWNAGGASSEELRSIWMKVHPPLLFLGYVLVQCAGVWGMGRLWRVEEMISPPDIIGKGAFLLTSLGIFTGSIWASDAWGSFWSWDPVESASLLPWMATVLFWSGTRTMLIPRLRADLIPYALPGAMLLLAVVVLAITQTALRCTLVAAVMGWAVSLAAVAAGILLAGAGFDLWSTLKQDARAAGIHRQTIEEFSDLLGP